MTTQTAPTRPDNPLAHALTTANLATEVAIVAAMEGLDPAGVTVHPRSFLPPYELPAVVVQLRAEAAVDVLADEFCLPASDGAEGNYTRRGLTTLAGDRVTLWVFSGRTA